MLRSLCDAAMWLEVQGEEKVLDFLPTKNMGLNTETFRTKMNFRDVNVMGNTECVKNESVLD